MARSSPERRWFVAILDPDTADPAAVAEAASSAPGVVGSRVHRRTHRGDHQLWLVLYVEARSSTTAQRVAHDAVFRLIWPMSRINEEFGDGKWTVALGRHTEYGPIERETAVLGEAESA